MHLKFLGSWKRSCSGNTPNGYVRVLLHCEAGVLEVCLDLSKHRTTFSYLFVLLSFSLSVILFLSVSVLFLPAACLVCIFASWERKMVMSPLWSPSFPQSLHVPFLFFPPFSLSRSFMIRLSVRLSILLLFLLVWITLPYVCFSSIYVILLSLSTGLSVSSSSFFILPLNQGALSSANNMPFHSTQQPPHFSFSGSFSDAQTLSPCHSRHVTPSLAPCASELPQPANAYEAKNERLKEIGRLQWTPMCFCHDVSCDVCFYVMFWSAFFFSFDEVRKIPFTNPTPLCLSWGFLISISFVSLNAICECISRHWFTESVAFIHSVSCRHGYCTMFGRQKPTV